MKRIIALLCAAALMGALTACAGSGTGSPTPSLSPSAALKPSVYTDADFDASGDIVIKTEYGVYGADVPEVSYTIQNNTPEEYVYGVEYRVEVRLDGNWYEVPFPENTAWISIGIILKPNDTNAHSFSFSELDYEMADGTYRLIKELGGKRYYAEFQVGPSPITAQTPFGYVALEQLPKEYTAEAAEANGDVVVTHTEIKNAGKLMEFVRKAALGMPVMIRIMQYTDEGDPIITDVIYRGYFLWRQDSSRDKFAGAGAGITEAIYSFLITDGDGLFVSNCASWEMTDTYLDRALVQLAPGVAFDELAEVVAIAGEMTAERLEWNITRYRVYSPDTIQNVALYGGLSYGYEGLTSSETREVSDPDGIATEITGAFWLDDNAYVLICKTTGSLTYFEVVGSSEYQSGYGTGYTVTDGKFEITGAS